MEINQFISAITSQLEDAEVEILHPLTEFKKLETWDSLTSFSVQVMIEDEYNVKLLTDEFKAVNTIEELFELVKSKVS